MAPLPAGRYVEHDATLTLRVQLAFPLVPAARVPGVSVTQSSVAPEPAELTPDLTTLGPAASPGSTEGPTNEGSTGLGVGLTTEDPGPTDPGPTNLDSKSPDLEPLEPTDLGPSDLDSPTDEALSVDPGIQIQPGTSQALLTQDEATTADPEDALPPVTDEIRTATSEIQQETTNENVEVHCVDLCLRTQTSTIHTILFMSSQRHLISNSEHVSVHYLQSNFFSQHHVRSFRFLSFSCFPLWMCVFSLVSSVRSHALCSGVRTQMCSSCRGYRRCSQSSTRMR